MTAVRRRRRTRPDARRRHVAVVAPLASVALIAVLAGCSSESEGALDQSCREFVAASPAEQTRLTGFWASPDRMHPDPRQTRDIPFYAAGLTGYCQSDPDRTLRRIAFDPLLGFVPV